MGLMDIFGNQDPEFNRGLLAMASQFGGAPSNVPQSFMGQAVNGMQAYNQSMDAGKKRKLQEEEERLMRQYRAMQMQGVQSEIAGRALTQAGLKKKHDREDRITAQLNGGGGMPPASQASSADMESFYRAGEQSGVGTKPAPGGMPDMPASGSLVSPVVMGMPRPAQGASQQQPGQSSYADMRRTEILRLNHEADIRQREGDLDGAKELRKLALERMPTATMRKVIKDGRVAVVPFYNDGSDGKLSEYTEAEKLHFGDNGQFLIGQDSYTGDVKSRMAKGQSPDSKASNALGWANHNQSKGRLNFEKGQATPGGKAPAGYRWSADGQTLEAIPGGPASKSAVASEGERKAATLVQRLESSERQLQDALNPKLKGGDPAAAKAGLVATGLRGAGLDMAADAWATPPARQRVEAAQLDILDAALTLGTGAAYTREQLEGYRKSYFPQPWDDPATVKDKDARLKNVIDAGKTQAGRAMGANAQSPKKSAMKGQVMDGYRFKGGDPADENNWEKI